MPFGVPAMQEHYRQARQALQAMRARSSQGSNAPIKKKWLCNKSAIGRKGDDNYPRKRWKWCREKITKKDVDRMGCIMVFKQVAQKVCFSGRP
jgi:hypothetical protein